MQYDFSLDRTEKFKGVEYRIIQVLDNDLLLAVVEEEYQGGNFPLNSYIITESK